MSSMLCLFSSVALALAGIACSSNNPAPFASGAGGAAGAGGVSLGGQNAAGGFPVSAPGGAGGVPASAGGVPGVFTVGPVQDSC